MTKQEFYQEADDIVELHKAYGNIIDWDKDESPVKWPGIVQDARESPIGTMSSQAT